MISNILLYGIEKFPLNYASNNVEKGKMIEYTHFDSFQLVAYENQIKDRLENEMDVDRMQNEIAAVALKLIALIFLV